MVAVFVALGTALALTLVDDPTAALPKYALRLEVGAAPSAHPIPAGFLGLSLEYPALLAYAGSDPAAPNPIFIRLVRTLAGGSPVIRIGGDTTDWIWWPVKRMARPPGVKYTLTRRWVAVARAVALALRSHLILGINLEADSRRVAGTEARALLKGLGGRVIAGFELGNEPDVYASIGWYNNSLGVGVPGRPRSCGLEAYVADYTAIGSVLPRRVPLAGPAFASPSSRWSAGTGQFLVANPRVRLLTLHVYPLRRCYTPPGSLGFPTIAHLLSAEAASGLVGNLRGALALARARGIPVRVDELNSVSCKGARGVSDTFASALWILEALFRFAQLGVQGVNIHTLPDAAYQPFVFAHVGARWRASIKPMYYGMLFFARAAPPGSRLLPTLDSPTAGLRSWATRGPGGWIRVVLVNDSPPRALTVVVRPPGAVRSASLERLLASGLQARSGVTIAGQSFDAPTATGELSGAFNASTVQPIRHRYVIELPRASAALLTLATT